MTSPHPQISLSVCGISKIFDARSQPVLDDVSLDLREGQIISILGPSGCGKSTLLHIMGLLDAPSSGKIIVNGKDCSKLNEHKRSQIRLNSIGFIYQFHHLLPEFSTKENLVIPQLVKGISRKEADLKAEEGLISVGLKDKMKSMISEISGGEKQRVAIARAFINTPKIILADEPTGNLDQYNSEKVLDLFISEAKSRNLSTVIVTHNLDLAKKTDKILALDSGKIKNKEDL